jgi:hypothetical protein
LLRYAHISATGNLSVAPSGGGAALWNVTVNKGASGAILTVYDGTDNTGTVVATIDASAVCNLWYGALCKNGIFCVLSVGNADVTVGYR